MIICLKIKQCSCAQSSFNSYKYKYIECPTSYKKTSDVTISGEFSLTILLLVLQEVSSMVKYDTDIHSSVVEF